MLVLALAGAAGEHIAADYALSADRLQARYAARGEQDQGPLLEAFLADKRTTAPDLIVDLLASLDVEALLGAGGLSGRDIAALRARLIGS